MFKKRSSHKRSNVGSRKNSAADSRVRNVSRRTILKAELLEQRVVLSASSLLSALRSDAIPVVSDVTPASEQVGLVSSSRSANLAVVDEGDFYWYQDEKVPLLQLQDEVVVGLSGDSGSSPFSPATQNLHPVSWVDSGALGEGRRILKKSPTANSLPGLSKKDADASLIEQLKQRDDVNWSAPVFYSSDFGSRVMVADEILVSLRSETSVDDFFSDGFSSFERIGGTSNQYLAVVKEGAGTAVLQLADDIQGDPRVEWASPNIYAEPQSSAVPNDPLFGQQANLHNTGQNNVNPGADAHLNEAWDDTTGLGSDLVIAVLDTGIDINHPDLDIWVNAGEIANNGIDDDGNGWVDDVNGWDFVGYDNDPSPTTVTDNHGTAVAGIAGAIGNNNVGISGVSQGAEIMPVTVLGGPISFANIAEAVNYAAGRTQDKTGVWSSADVINMSFSYPSNTLLDESISWAATSGRNGLGIPVFAATGNDATGYVDVVGPQLIPGNYIAAWQYVKNSDQVHVGQDTAWLGEVTFPGGTVERFDVAPVGWTTGGDANWFLDDDPAHSYGTGELVYRAGSINDGEATVLFSPEFTVDFSSVGNLSYKIWTDSQAGGDGVQLFISSDGGNTFTYQPFDRSGSTAVASNIEYPASHDDTIAVGASSDWDYRSDFSQYGEGLDFVAPSNGGFNGVTTTDRTGIAGYSAGDYTSTFGGTSAATPLATGIAALMLAKNPYLTAAEIRSIMRNTADQIGSVTYDADGFNEFYGHGRVNAFAAIKAVNSPIEIPGHVLWLDGSDVNGDGAPDSGSGSASISTWVDKSSGQGFNNVTVTNGSPTQQFDVRNGNGVVRFSLNSQDKLDNHDLNLSNNYTVLAVVDPAGSGRHILSGLNTNGTDAVLYTSSTNWNFYDGQTTGNSVQTIANDPLSGYHLVGVQLDATDDRGFFDDITNSSVSWGAATLDGIRIGNLDRDTPSSTNRSEAWGGDIAEILIYDRTLSPSELNDVRGYLSSKWDLGLRAATGAATEIETGNLSTSVPPQLVPSANVSGQTNVARNNLGAVAFAQDFVSSNYKPLRAIDGDYSDSASGGGSPQEAWVGGQVDTFLGVRFAEPHAIDKIGFQNQYSNRLDGLFTLEYTTDSFASLTPHADLGFSPTEVESLSWTAIDTIYIDDTVDTRRLYQFDTIANVTGVRLVLQAADGQAPIAIAEIEAWE